MVLSIRIRPFRVSLSSLLFPVFPVFHVSLAFRIYSKVEVEELVVVAALRIVEQTCRLFLKVLRSWGKKYAAGQAEAEMMLAEK